MSAHHCASAPYRAGKYDQLRKDLVMGGVEIMSGVKTRTTEVDMALERELKACHGVAATAIRLLGNMRNDLDAG